MPELPEVETTRRGVAPHIVGRTIRGAVVRQANLRWPVPDLDQLLRDRKVLAVERRAKYILIRFAHGTLMIHLGMSGSLRLVPAATAPRPHDHVDLLCAGLCLRLHDPRRFGAMLWTDADPLDHPRLRDLGPEPLSDAFDGSRLYQTARGRKRAIKTLLMDGRTVVGVGNIYATEALFRAGIHPARAAGRIGRERYHRLAAAVITVLEEAIAVGGTTLRDFTAADGRPGYFRIQLAVYGRAGEPCPACGRPLLGRSIGQRNSVYCGHCQH
jgi:formamidopyrimidine-DNA glycosylase